MLHVFCTYPVVFRVEVAGGLIQGKEATSAASEERPCERMKKIKSASRES